MLGLDLLLGFQLQGLVEVHGEDRDMVAAVKVEPHRLLSQAGKVGDLLLGTVLLDVLAGFIIDDHLGFVDGQRHRYTLYRAHRPDDVADRPVDFVVADRLLFGTLLG